MSLRERINNQRIQHIVSSYRLQGDDGAEFFAQLEDLAHRYPSPLIELALAEVLVESWLNTPLIRGLIFLQRVRHTLQEWEVEGLVSSRITPPQFFYITGLDPAPIFGNPRALTPSLFFPG